MKNSYLPLLLLFVISFYTSCEPGSSDDIEPEAEEIIEIPDEIFKAALVSSNTIDTNGDRVGDSDIDLNNDGEIQRSEAELIEGLIMNFSYYGIGRLVNFSGIENFKNLQYLKITGLWDSAGEENTEPEFELISHDFTGLKELEYLEFNNLFTNFIDVLNLSGLNKLKEVKLINDKPYYDVFTEENIVLPVNFMDVNLAGTSSLVSLDITNSFLNLDLCQVASLKKLNMHYLEGGEPEVFDFHCLTELEWLDISENRIHTLILKNSSALSTFIATDVYSLQGLNFFPYVDYICIDDIPEEFEQIESLKGETTVVTTDCTI